jgi:tetratricopeptide (TPR) repeat protein
LLFFFANRKKAEAGELEEAERQLSAAIKVHGGSASALNNRAQVRQFLKRFDDAMSDLNEAIVKAAARGDTVTLRQAHCQRGMLYRKEVSCIYYLLLFFCLLFSVIISSCETDKIFCFF